MTKKRLSRARRVFVRMVTLLVLPGMFGISCASVPPAEGKSTGGGRPLPAAEGAGIPYYLDNMDDPQPADANLFIGGRGVWCELGAVASEAACEEAGLLAATYDPLNHFGTSGYGLTLSYNVTKSDSLASYYEHVYNGDGVEGTLTDLSSMDLLRFKVKGEGASAGAAMQFSLRLADYAWNMIYIPIQGVSADWEEKIVDLKSLSMPPGGFDWTQARELTIIFANNHGNGASNALPLAGTLHFDDFAFWDTHTQVTTDEQFLDLVERRSFEYFWQAADPLTGLIRERKTDAEVASIASVGFGLTALCTADQRGWISHADAAGRVLTTLNSFYDDPDIPGGPRVAGMHGLFYHFVNIHDGTPMWDNDGWGDGVSTIDSALLMAGVLTVRQCFTEPEIVTRATAIYAAADWNWFLNEDASTPQADRGKIYMCWTPLKGNVCLRAKDDSKWVWSGYNEALILYLLAMGSPTHPIPAGSWDQWTSSYTMGTGEYYDHEILLHVPGPLFAHQYPQAWIDFRGKKDKFVNYFENSRLATLANRAYSKGEWYPDPPEDLWGFTASDGPNPGTCTGKTYLPYGYPPLPPVDQAVNDGTIAPSAAGGSIVFTPAESISTLRFMFANYPENLWGLYGLKDSFNVNVKCAPGWFDNDYIGLDVGIGLIMIENYRSGLIWGNFMKNTEIGAAMKAAGFVSDGTKVFLPVVTR